MMQPSVFPGRCFKVVVCGNSGAGKTSIVKTFKAGEESMNHASTVGVDFVSSTYEHNGEEWKFQIWDTAGQERFQAITDAYFRAAHIVIGVVDMKHLLTQMGKAVPSESVTEMSAVAHAEQEAERIFKETFRNSLEKFNRTSIPYEEIRKKPVFICMGNKIDLIVKNPEDFLVRNALAKKCSEEGGFFIDSSVKQCTGIQEAFVLVMREAIRIVREHEKIHGRATATTSLDMGDSISSLRPEMESFTPQDAGNLRLFRHRVRAHTLARSSDSFLFGYFDIGYLMRRFFGANIDPEVELKKKIALNNETMSELSAEIQKYTAQANWYRTQSMDALRRGKKIDAARFTKQALEIDQHILGLDTRISDLRRQGMQLESAKLTSQTLSTMTQNASAIKLMNNKFAADHGKKTEDALDDIRETFEEAAEFNRQMNASIYGEEAVEGADQDAVSAELEEMEQRLLEEQLSSIPAPVRPYHSSTPASAVTINHYHPPQAQAAPPPGIRIPSSSAAAAMPPVHNGVPVYTSPSSAGFPAVPAHFVGATSVVPPSSAAAAALSHADYDAEEMEAVQRLLAEMRAKKQPSGTPLRN